jgi:NCAIR mutase (PurE)-related protein
MNAPEFKLDFLRDARIGMDEAVFAAGKSAAQITQILDAAAPVARGLLLTRLAPEKYDALPDRHRARLDYDAVCGIAVFGDPRPLRETRAVAIVCAGTSDIPVSREAARTLSYYGQPCREFSDIGVAGLWRLLERIEEIRRAPVVIVAAGMDAALPSVVGGLVPGAVIAIPTSVGYGVATGGVTALHSALASCAPGITVVNIDNGYGAACAALRIMAAARMLGERAED